MHMMDKFLATEVWATLNVASTGLVAGAAHKTQKRLEPKDAPTLAVMAAFVFAAQMVNFPVAPGVSGHLLGGALVAILLGVAPAMLIMTVVLVIQCLLFQDGGLTVLGANVFNMAVIAPCVAWVTYHWVRRLGANLRVASFAAFVAAWLSVLLSSAAAAAQLTLSGEEALAVFPPVLGWHLLIGLGEGLITVAALQLVWRSRPEMAPVPVSVSGGDPA